MSSRAVARRLRGWSLAARAGSPLGTLVTTYEGQKIVLILKQTLFVSGDIDDLSGFAAIAYNFEVLCLSTFVIHSVETHGP